MPQPATYTGTNNSVTSSHKIMRSVGHRVRDIEADDGEGSDQGGLLSQSSDSIKAINWKPFEMQFNFEEEEIAGLKEAF